MLKQLVMFVVALTSTAGFAATGTDISSYWEIFSNQPYEEGAFPDSNVWYERIRIGVDSSKSTALKITVPPQATDAYISFTVYSQRFGTMLDSRATIHSGDMKPNADGTYTLYALPSSRIESSALQNKFLLYFDETQEAMSYIEIWFRTYDIREQNRPILPVVEAVDPDDVTQAVAAPPRIVAYQPSRFTNIDLLPPSPDANGWFRFFRPANTTGLYSNPDTSYLSTRMIQSRRADLIAVTRFRRPDAKSWSLCMAGGLLQQTGSCLSRVNAVYDGDYVVVVISHTDPRTPAEKNRINYLPHTNFRLGTGAIYRNLLPSETAPTSIVNVPLLPKKSERAPNFDAHEYAAEKTMMEFGPVGIQCVKGTSDVPRHEDDPPPCDWRKAVQALTEYQESLR